jgi:hypothetical protein
LNPTKPLTFIISNPNKIIQILINTIKPQLQTSKLRYSQTQIKPKSDPWLHEDRSGRGGAENSGGESRAEQSIREERENFKKNEEKWVFGYTDSGTWNSKPGIAGLSFSGGVKQCLSHRV